MESLGGVNGFWKGRKALITGATGLIGSWLVKALQAEGALVVALVQDADPQSELYRSGEVRHISVVHGELEGLPSIERAINLHEVDTVFHLGAQTIVSVAHRSPLPTFEANIRGTYNLLEACRVHCNLVDRVVIASSDKAYGEHGRLAYTEELGSRACYPYEVSKCCSELIARCYYQTYDIPLAIARCGNVYGGGDLNWSRIVPGTVRALLQRQRPIIRSDGTYVRDYIYVKDIVQAYLRLAECLDGGQVRGEAFNFSSEMPMTVMDLVRVIQKLMGCEEIEPEVRNSAEGEIRYQHLSAAKARCVLGWQSRYELEDGLRESIEWYRRFLAD